ncbi:MAG: IPT/TIG domain-containing protein, partial [Anaerolineae bacterium]
VTDTLPAGTVFRDAFLDTDTGPIQFSPVSSGTGFVVWDIGAMDAGAYASLEVVLDINGATQTGTVLTNTAEVMAVPGEDNLADNVSVWVEKLNPPGPNLRVRKTGDWNDNGTNTRSAWYEVVVENVGGLPVNNVVVTDTYPASMVLLGGVNSDWSSFWSWTDNPATNELVVTFDKLNPGKVARIYFNAEVPGSGPLANGLTFNNLVRVKRPLGDPTPLDNVDHFTLTTGPDLAVQKEWLSGIPIPGNLITFSIHWSNRERRQEWWWWGTQGDVWITDTLPSELEFVSAVWPSCGNCPIGPDVIKGNEYGFRLGPIPGGGADEILITTLVSDTARSGTLLTNRVRVTSTAPLTDVEPSLQNNVSAIDIPVLTPTGSADMSVVKTAPPGPVLVGQKLVYTLTVKNNGPDPATGVVLYDSPPPSVLPNVLFGANNCQLTNAGNLFCNLGGMLPGEAVTVTLWVTPTVARDIVNYAAVSANEADPDNQNNISGVQTAVTDPVQVSLIGILPDFGTNDKTTNVTVLGVNFQNGATLSLGGTPLQSVTFISPNQLQAVVPAGMPPGAYDLMVVNPDGLSDTLLNAFVVLQPTPPTLLLSWPPQGPNDVPVTLDIFGLNFAPGISATLSGGVNPRVPGVFVPPTNIPLKGISLLSANHIRAIVPINTPPGVYTLTVTNPDQTSASLVDAYESVDATLLDDLYATTLDFWAQPPAIRAGAAVTPVIGLRVHRASGQTPLVGVEVAFFDGNP